MEPSRWPEIRTAFDELVELEPACRAERLAALSASDPELHRAVERLLEADAEADACLAGRVPFERTLPGDGSETARVDRVPDPLGLAGRTLSHFRVLEPLGAGGMGVVYRAEDTRLHRPVALKLPLPSHRVDTSTKQRFLREARSAAALDHPNVCSVYEVGESEDGLLFLAMALYRGETLKDLLDRDGRLPIERVVEIGRQIAQGLAAAHEAGIVHRDLKPGNVMLLPNGPVKILDFGLARARVSSRTDSRRLLGTAAYMAPEQIRGDPVDARADLWALGVVLYEMLTGRIPFQGEHEVSLAHAIVHEEPIPPSALSLEAPPRLEQLILRLLGKSPASRYGTAQEVDAAFAAIQVGQPFLRRTWRSRRTALALTGALGLIVGAVWAYGHVRPAPARSPSNLLAGAPERLDPSLIAVLPFRVVSSDTSHAALREGMVDILEAEFSGAGGARIVPARTVLAAWQQALGPRRSELTEKEARGVARRLGAGSVVLGTVVSMPGRVILNGSLLDTEAGRVRAEAKAEGMPDSLHWLVDRFAAQLAALGAGESADHLASLTSTSLPALYAYLAGKAAHRAGQYGSAVRNFGRALELDSTFARAALAYSVSSTWNGDTAGMAYGVRFALAHRDRLGSRERVFLEAVAGPRYPAEPQPRERIQAWEDAARQVPDDPDVLIQLGDAYLHEGAGAGLDEPLRLAAGALNRALALDTTLFLEPVIHLLAIAAMERDTATVRRLVRRIPRNDPATALHWLEAGAALGDSAMLALARAQFDSAGGVNGMRWLLLDARSFGFAIQEAERVIALYFGRSRTGPGEVWPILEVYAFNHELGRPAAAAAALGHLSPEAALLPVVSMVIVSQALYGDVDTVATAAALAHLGSFKPATRDSGSREVQARSICIMERWRLSRGDTRTARAAIARLAGGRAWGCAVLLAAQLAAAERRPDAGAAFARLDSLLLAGGGKPEWTMELSRWWEAQGDVAAALRAARRCQQYAWLVNLTYCLREQGRLASIIGDRVTATRAYRHYLALRYSPEASVKPEVERVRAELSLLVTESQ
jgi:tetratricopeptide (TPR) repeat protein/predicted Ser/Thr protein kinase